MADLLSAGLTLDWSVTVPVDPARGFRFEPGWTLGARDRTDITYLEALS